MGARVRLPLVLITALMLQTTVVLRFEVSGVIPDVMLLVALAAGIAGGPERGAVAGFGAGLVIDLFLQTPLGLSALAYSLVAYAVGLLSEGTVRAAWWIPVVTTAIGSAAGVVVFGLGGALVGRDDLLRQRLLLVAVVVAVINGILAPLALKAMSWALAGDTPSPAVRSG